MASPQTLDVADRRVLAAWAADCAERVLPILEAEAPDEERARDGIARARDFARGERDAAAEIRRRFEAGRAAASASTRAGAAAARAAGQASGVAHMGAHALGAAAYAAVAAELASPGAGDRERAWQLAHMDDDVRAALRRLPALGADASGPLGAGLLASGALGEHIRTLQQALAQP
ncbi:putative immunity protein [Agrococcus sp. SGAir0287]|uniref:putative immunity protein n=1 Tax=Agrococcus sp. SGAir0287 TaxID=2070347 RepID=UPI0010CD3542|nr:hypothetical protein [Agrococcus sp. SGAir0287]QCR18472.1 hypothetical protein C1N71_02575 [Agrococcus sp. SGAir0287]